MPQWIYSRSPGDCDPNEFRVAENFKSLSDSWIVCWGFYYTDNRGTKREGDFLVFGPNSNPCRTVA